MKNIIACGVSILIGLVWSAAVVVTGPFILFCIFTALGLLLVFDKADKYAYVEICKEFVKEAYVDIPVYCFSLKCLKNESI